MIQLAIMLPLVAGGVGGALWRQYKNRHQNIAPDKSLYLETESAVNNEDQNQPLCEGSDTGVQVFDDVGELQHYQYVTWYAFAFAAAGAWFYAPATLMSVPLLGYNAYHFVRTLRESDSKGRGSPLTLFEIISVAGTLITGRPLAASVLLLFSFGTRKLLLQAGNISHHVDLSQSLNSSRLQIWVLRDGAEIQITVDELQELDIVVLSPGDTISLCGEVTQGSGVVRQFSLSKEMKLVPKQVGDKVFPYTQLVSGHLHVQLN
ncbi:MAG: hypothetical protein GKR96_08995 [Gammaproteobacteria bacterium]|nr:hypothetical protein [Gammaproteobacteria bacterium]